MSANVPNIDQLVRPEYKYGFVSEIDTDSLPPGLNEDVIREISARKGEPQFLLEWRLKAYRHWTTLKEPHWAKAVYPPIDYQAISYYAAPRSRARYSSMDEVDPELLKTFEKLGIPLSERARLA
ncbi:MAG: Fe-S cluster assembly protein SufB, partial [Verrucomicrobiota bacterium]|nr:Fe-S cluster assembly protein SufB [Verrucomicrobiota bacterium]